MNPRGQKRVKVEDIVQNYHFTLCHYITTTRCVTTRKTAVLSATSSSTNLTWIDPGFDATHRGEKPTNNYLSHDTALKYGYTLIISPWCMQMLRVVYGT